MLDYHKIGKSILKVVISVIRVSMHLKIYDMRESVSDVFVIQCTSIYIKKKYIYNIIARDQLPMEVCFDVHLILSWGRGSHI